jgi:O-antigen ligase
VVLALVVAFHDGGSSPLGLAIAAVGVSLGLFLALVLCASGRLPLPRTSGAGLVALAGLALWCLTALASISWSLSPAESWTDGIRVAAATGALCGGMWIGAFARRPAQGACVVLAGIAATVAVYAIAQRSYSSEYIASSFPRLREPLGYANSLAALFVSGIPAALVLGSRRERLARALGSAIVAALVLALALTGSRGGILAAVIATALVLGLADRRLELVATILCGLVPALPAAYYGIGLPTFAAPPAPASPPPSAGGGLLAALIAAVLVAAVLGPLAQALVTRLSPANRRRSLYSAEALAAGLVVLGLAVAAVHAGGPIALVQQSWDQLSGSGQVSNSTGGRLTSLSSNLRYRWWSEAWHAFTLRPIEGFGAGTFDLIDQLSRPDATVAHEAHSSWLQVLSGTGVVGGLAALAALGGSVWACVGGWRRLQGEERVAAAALCATVAGLALHAQIDWDWTFALIALVGYPLPGILATAGRGTVQARGLERGLAGAALPLVAVLAIACALPYLSTRAVDRSQALQASGSNDSALVQDDLAVSLDPLSTDALVDRANLLQLLNRPADAAADMRRALKLEPANADLWIAAADLQSPPWHDAKGACTSARTALALSPFSGLAGDSVGEHCTAATSG